MFKALLCLHIVSAWDQIFESRNSTWSPSRARARIPSLFEADFDVPVSSCTSFCIIKGVDDEYVERVHFLFEDGANDNLNLRLHQELSTVNIEYSVYSVQDNAFSSRKIGYFKPFWMDFGSPSHSLLRKGAQGSLMKTFPPGYGMLREYAAFIMNHSVKGEFFIPMTIPMNIDRIGDGILKILPKNSQSDKLAHAPCFVYQNHLVFALISMNPFIGSLKTGVQGCRSSSRSNFAFFTHNAFILPNIHFVSNTTLLSFRKLRIPCMDRPFSKRTKRLVEAMNIFTFDVVLRSLGFPQRVRFGVQVAIDTLKECVLKKNMTPQQTVHFMYSAQPMAFIPSIWYELESILSSGSEDPIDNVRALRTIALRKIHSLSTASDFHLSSLTHYRRMLTRFS